MALAQLKAVDEPFTLLQEIREQTTSLLRNVREALLEARDERDVELIRTQAIVNLRVIFQPVGVLTDEYVIHKLATLDAIEQESLLGRMNAQVRARKWRKALVDRYFPE
jgi:hypothetical protein